MDAELKAKWVAALRSGQYKQAKEALRNDLGYCCLGVLLDLSGLGSWEEDVYFVGDGNDTQQGIEGDLCDLKEHFGLSPAQEGRLVSMNDGKDEWEGKQQTFSEIADYIEAHL